MIGEDKKSEWRGGFRRRKRETTLGQRKQTKEEEEEAARGKREDPKRRTALPAKSVIETREPMTMPAMAAAPNPSLVPFHVFSFVIDIVGSDGSLAWSKDCLLLGSKVLLNPGDRSV